MMQNKPTISLSATKAKSGESIFATGKGFTPNRSALSHLRKPDTSEYNPLRIRTNASGEFVHRIDTTMLDAGVFELWAEDEASKTLSNRIQFAVESSEH
jgi:hypothetical protein